MVDQLFILTEQLFCCLFIFKGLSLLLQTPSWLSLIKLIVSMEKSQLQSLVLVSSLLGLCFGLFIVLTHNDWIWSYSVIVTVLGWITCLKCGFFLLFPQLAVWCIKTLYGSYKPLVLKWYFKGCGGVYILLSVLVGSAHI